MTLMANSRHEPAPLTQTRLTVFTQPRRLREIDVALNAADVNFYLDCRQCSADLDPARL